MGEMDHMTVWLCVSLCACRLQRADRRLPHLSEASHLPDLARPPGLHGRQQACVQRLHLRLVPRCPLLHDGGEAHPEDRLTD